LLSGLHILFCYLVCIDKTQKSSANGEVLGTFITWVMLGGRDVDTEEAGPTAASAGPDQFIVQLSTSLLVQTLDAADNSAKSIFKLISS